MRLPASPRLRSPSATALVGALVGGLVAGVPGPATAGTAVPGTPSSSTSLAAQVAQLDRDVTRVADELARGAVAYEAAQAQLGRRTQEQFAARDAAEASEADAAQTRSAFGGLARAAYKGGLPPLVTAVLSGDPRLVSDLAYVQRSVDRAAVDRRAEARAAYLRSVGADAALGQTDDARRTALADQQALDAQLAELTATADRLTGELTATAARLARARAVEAARARAASVRESRRLQALQAQSRAAASAVSNGGGAGPSGIPTGTVQTGTVPTGTVPTGTVPTGSGAGCRPPGPYGEANGFLSPESLCPLAVGRGHRLRTDAARAFDQLNAFHVAQLGRPLCITDSYRSYAAQVDVFRRKPALAAVPGRSQHGWGLAVDLCGGVQVFGTPEHEWMRANASRFGYVHPAWAQRGGSRPEPWHWEYVGG